MKTVLFLGAGYSARAAINRAKAAGWRTIGTTRDAAKLPSLASAGCEALIFDGESVSDDLKVAMSSANAVVISIAPDRGSSASDPVLGVFGEIIQTSGHLRHVCYLSTIGVYGDFGGAWIDETAETHPTSARGQARVRAETAWREMAKQSDGRWRVHILRLAGIYGPSRNPIARIRNGTARAIIKPGQVFNRIHVADIASAIMAGLDGRGTHDVYNVTDNEPAPPEDVIFHAAELIGAPRPRPIPFEAADLTPMARSFYSDVKRVKNTRLCEDLGVTLRYPSRGAVKSWLDWRDRLTLV
ncbi:MAG: SDR family oxidoreductase, partial [Pseudomonadota bacterium]